MKTKKLAELLGISDSMTRRLIRKGMPSDTLEAAIKWRGSWLNMDLTQTKPYRMTGNSGLKREAAPQVTARDFDKLQDVDIDSELNNVDIDAMLNNVDIDAMLNQFNSDVEREIAGKVLTHTIPELWFEQSGWLGAILRDHGVTITAEQLLNVQSCLFLVYAQNVIKYLEESDDLIFHTGPILRAVRGDEIYPSLIARLNQILEAETAL